MKTIKRSHFSIIPRTFPIALPLDIPFGKTILITERLSARAEATPCGRTACACCSFLGCDTSNLLCGHGICPESRFVE